MRTPASSSTFGLRPGTRRPSSHPILHPIPAPVPGAGIFTLYRATAPAYVSSCRRPCPVHLRLRLGCARAHGKSRLTRSCIQSLLLSRGIAVPRPRILFSSIGTVSPKGTPQRNPRRSRPRPREPFSSIGIVSPKGTLQRKSRKNSPRLPAPPGRGTAKRAAVGFR